MPLDRLFTQDGISLEILSLTILGIPGIIFRNMDWDIKIKPG